MQQLTAVEVAYYFIKKAKDDRVTLTPLKLQKLLYYAQGWHLALAETPIFEDKIFAWRYGPVVRSVYDKFKKHGSQNLAESDCPPAPEMEGPTQALLDIVWKKYGSLDAMKLVEFTHKSDPWINAVEDPFSDEISPQSIKAYFKSLG